MKEKLAVILLMMFYGVISITLRAIHLPSDHIALIRGVIGLVVVFAVKMCFARTFPRKVPWKDWLRMILCGVVTVVYWISMNYAFRDAPVSIVTLTIYLYPSVMMIFSPVLFGEERKKKQVICFLLSTVGVVMIIGVRFSEMQPKYALGIGCAFLTALCTAAIQLLNKSVRSVGGMDKSLIQCLTAVLLLIPWNLARGGLHIGGETVTGWIAVFVLGAFYTGLGYCLNYYLLMRMTGQDYAILTYVDPLTAMLVSAFYWKESVTPIQVVGGILLIGSTFFCEIDWKSIRGKPR